MKDQSDEMEYTERSPFINFIDNVSMVLALVGLGYFIACFAMWPILWFKSFYDVAKLFGLFLAVGIVGKFFVYASDFWKRRGALRKRQANPHSENWES